MIIITGSESFVGKELIKKLKMENIEFVGIDLVDTPTTNYEYKKIDIRDSSISELITENTDTIIHLASLSSDPLCRGKSYECFDVNVMGTLNLMNAAKEKNVKQFIFASSEWVYDQFPDDQERDETTTINISNHKSEYALSKLVSESNLRQEYDQDFCDVTILRFGIIYGPRKNNWSAVESILNQVKKHDVVTVNSKRNGRRFVHVSDICDGIIKSIGLKGFNVINLTGDLVITIGDLISESEKILSKKISVIEKNPNEVNLRNPSNKKAKEVINWSPKLTLNQGLKTVLEYV